MINTPQLRTCVVTGRFNPAILSPAWIVANAILPDGETEVGSLVGTNIVQYSLAGLTWQTTLSRLEAFTNLPEVDPGKFVASVLHLLSHTPVSAVGSNFVFQVAEEHSEDLFGLIASKLESVSADSEHEMLDYSATITLEQEDCIISIILDSSQRKVHTVRFNFNRFIPDASAGAEAALKWSSDEVEAVRLYGRLIGETNARPS